VLPLAARRKETRWIGQAGVTGVLAMAVGQTGRDHLAPVLPRPLGRAAKGHLRSACCCRCQRGQLHETQPNGLICTIAARSSNLLRLGHQRKGLSWLSCSTTPFTRWETLSQRQSTRAAPAAVCSGRSCSSRRRRKEGRNRSQHCPTSCCWLRRRRARRPARLAMEITTSPAPSGA
jgi:hypothetical protein